MNLSKKIYVKFRHDLGEEIKKQRLSRGWSLEQAAKELNLKHPRVLDTIEKGISIRFFLFFTIIAAYGCRLNISLVAND